MQLRSTGKDAYFVASNSKNGFCSYYSECFDHARIHELYLIKGGPGCGKSYFLSEVAKEGERRGWYCEYIYCSSDPDSLDGVILTGEGRCVALLDATAPHVYEPQLPGARETLLDLGAFWDSTHLQKNARACQTLNQKKQTAWRRAYRYLESYGILARTVSELVEPYLRREAIARLAQRITGDIPTGEGYEVRPALLSSFGMKGAVVLDTFSALAERVILVSDCRGAAEELMRALGEIAVGLRTPIRVSHDPLLPERVDGIFFDAVGLAVVVAAKQQTFPGARRLDLRRFVEISRMREVRQALTYAERMKRAMLSGAEEALECVREQHFALEKIYCEAMDFEAKEAFTKNFISKLFSCSCQEKGDVIE